MMPLRPARWVVLTPASCCCGGSSCGAVATKGRYMNAELAVAAVAIAMELKGPNLNGVPQSQGSSNC